MADDSFYERKYKGEVLLSYELSKEQKEISSKILSNFISGIDSLVFAVCGAGKTELVFEVIDYALKNHLSVGFAVPRRDVVIELEKRFQKTFNQYTVISIYGGHTKKLIGDIICLTTHQLYRYIDFFDLLILDEIDAFPFKDNFVLNALFKRSVRKNYVLMSATPSDDTINEFKNMKGKGYLELHTRYHKKPIPVPKIVINFSFLLMYITLKKLKKFLNENKPVLVFVPTIEECEILFKLFKMFAKHGNYVHSKRNGRSEIIDEFRCQKIKYLVTTAVLERGVTIKNLQVIIYNASHQIYTKESLIQISGRVGRVIGATDGEVYYIANKKTKAMADSIASIQKSNSYL